MRARDANKRHFQVETLEERLALDGTMTTYSVTVTDTTSRPTIGLVGPANGNSSVSYSVDGTSSITVTVESGPRAPVVLPVVVLPVVVLPVVPPPNL